MVCRDSFLGKYFNTEEEKSGTKCRGHPAPGVTHADLPVPMFDFSFAKPVQRNRARSHPKPPLLPGILCVPPFFLCVGKSKGNAAPAGKPVPGAASVWPVAQPPGTENGHAALLDCTARPLPAHWSTKENRPHVAHPIRAVRARPSPRLGGEGDSRLPRRRGAGYRGFRPAAVQAAGDGASEKRNPRTARCRHRRPSCASSRCTTAPQPKSPRR